MNPQEYTSIREPWFLRWSKSDEEEVAYSIQAAIISYLLLTKPAGFQVTYLYSPDIKLKGHLLFGKVKTYLHAAAAIQKEIFRERILLKNGSMFYCKKLPVAAAVRGNLVIVDNPSQELFYHGLLPLIGKSTVVMNIIGEQGRNIVGKLDPQGILQVKKTTLEDATKRLRDIEWKRVTMKERSYI